MVSFAGIKKFDGINLSRVVRKPIIDRTVLTLRIGFVILSLFLLAILVTQIYATKTKLKTSVMELQNGVKPDSDPLALTVGFSRKDYSILSKQPLLGALDSGAKPGPASQPKPISTIPLGLIGTYLESGHEPYAIIEDKKKNSQEVFNIGETIFGEATLKKILADRVEIDRNGQIEQLILDDLSDNKPDFKGGVAAIDNNQYVVDEGELDKALENLPLLLTQARAVPYFKDGVSIGLRLFAIKSDSIFEKIGLKNGDILKAVNGNSLGDITQAMKLFETLKQERSLLLKLERNLEEKDFRYEIK